MKIEFDLKPCPFCGGDDLTVDSLITGNRGHVDYMCVSCSKCGTKFVLKHDDCFRQFKEANPIDIWNLRTEV